MATGACGICCDVCRLHLKGVCSSCGPGTGEEAARKLAAQERIFAQPCPVLACARLKHIDYCMRDCQDFPCDNFRHGPYPYSQSFIDMQERRKDEPPKAYAPDGSHLTVDAAYWDEVAQRDMTALCNVTFFEEVAPDTLQYRFLNEAIRIHLSQRSLLRETPQGSWKQTEDPLLLLVTVMYLKAVNEIYPMGRDIVGTKDLKEGHFFAGPHEFRTQPLLHRFSGDIVGFQRAARKLDGEPVDMADAAFRLLPFPRVPIYFLLWEGDEEFKPRLQVLFDRSIERILAADAIWALVNRVAMAFSD